MLRDGSGGGADPEGFQEFREFGRAAFKLLALIEEVADGLDDGMGGGRRVEGAFDFFLGAAEGGAGGHGPGQRASGAPGGRFHLRHTAEGRADGRAEGSDDRGRDVVQGRQDAVIGAGSGGEGREGDDEGALGDGAVKIGRASPSLGDGEQDGAADVLVERVGEGAEGLADGGAEAGG